jgi:hypothetical protein
MNVGKVAGATQNLDATTPCEKWEVVPVVVEVEVAVPRSMPAGW